MAIAQTETPARRPLRLWPGVVIVVLQWLGWVVVPRVAPEAGGTAILIGFVGGLAIMLWWLFFSRAAWSERLGAIVLMVVGLAATSRLVHESIAGGMMGFMLYMLAMPVLSLALVAWAVASRNLSTGLRRVALVATIVLACLAFTLIRTNGITGNAASDLAWRWTPTPEQRLLARAGDEPAVLPAAQTAPPAQPEAIPTQPEAIPTQVPAEEHGPESPAPAPTGTDTDAAWPGFRGPERDGIVRGVRIATDWTGSPPVELWRRPVGPGWSSFVVRGERLFTQEQRGEDELVSAHDLRTGEPLWRHRDAARFWESNAGAGPRGTPTLAHGRVYTIGATGILNALDARDGSPVWSRNVATDTDSEVPPWGIASSPLVVGDLVVAAAAGSIAAYDAASGNPRWFGPAGGGGYSSPQLSTIDGVAQIVQVNGVGASGFAPSDGAVLWKHAWGGDGIVQPAFIAGSDVLIGSGSGLAANTGLLRAHIAQAPEGWKVTERWMSTGLKPYFNDFVVHEGHAYGFDGSILASVDLEDGTRRWKGGRFGHGQLVLLADQNLLLVLSEAGEVALVAATPDKFTELARMPAIEGKTWNHPVLVGDILLVRNDEEMAAFRLPLADR